MIKAKIIISILILTVAFGLLNLNQQSLDQKRVEINNGLLKAELVNTPKRRKIGLSEKKGLSFDEGMLFIYDNLSFPSIWMKDMDFSIDIIWLSKEKKIVDYKENVTPETYPNSFSPSKPAKYVLEVKAGFIKKNDLKAEDKLDFDL